MKAVYCNQHLQKLKKEQVERRKKLRFFSSPITTLRYFSIVVHNWLKDCITYSVAHPITLWILIPCIAFYVSGLRVSALQPYWDSFEAGVWFVIWWFILGVLSSIGLGTGMHSGLLFLFPYIIRVSTAAQVCGNLAFTEAMDGTLGCIPEAPKYTVSFWEVFLRVFPACFLWGAGTATGEIPPFLLTRAARLAGEKNSEFDDMEQEPTDIVSRMKLWMVNCLQKYGFWAVLLFSAWPNMAFDLCGMACGHFLMPFATFFGAVFLGKALIKVNMQSAVFIILSNMRFLNAVIDFISQISPYVGQLLLDLVEENKANLLNPGAPSTKSESLLGKLWGLVVFAFVAYFVIGMIEAFAQQQAAQEDDDTNKNIMEQHKGRSWRQRNLSFARREASQREQKEKMERSLRMRALIAVVLLLSFATAHYLGSFFGHFRTACLIAQLLAVVIIGLVMGWHFLAEEFRLISVCFVMMWLPHLARIQSVADWIYAHSL